MSREEWDIFIRYAYIEAPHIFPPKKSRDVHCAADYYRHRVCQIRIRTQNALFLLAIHIYHGGQSVGNTSVIGKRYIKSPRAGPRVAKCRSIRGTGPIARSGAVL